MGKAGKLFELVKLRSMVVDAEKDGVARWAEAYDNRVTRVGRFLRQTRLDELPQLLNVLRGEMSLIGPPARATGVHCRSSGRDTLLPDSPDGKARTDRLGSGEL